MDTTKILGEAVGIQWQGTRDLTATSSPAGLTTGLIIGRFKRGRIDQAMLITNDTIRARLGYNAFNADYQAVQDCLDTGVPNVWVLRVSDPLSPIPTPTILFPQDPENDHIIVFNTVDGLVTTRIEITSDHLATHIDKLTMQYQEQVQSAVINAEMTFVEFTWPMAIREEMSFSAYFSKGSNNGLVANATIYAELVSAAPGIAYIDDTNENRLITGIEWKNPTTVHFTFTEHDAVGDTLIITDQAYDLVILMNGVLTTTPIVLTTDDIADGIELNFPVSSDTKLTITAQINHTDIHGNVVAGLIATSVMSYDYPAMIGQERFDKQYPLAPVDGNNPNRTVPLPSPYNFGGMNTLYWSADGQFLVLLHSTENPSMLAQNQDGYLRLVPTSYMGTNDVTHTPRYTAGSLISANGQLIISGFQENATPINPEASPKAIKKLTSRNYDHTVNFLPAPPSYIGFDAMFITADNKFIVSATDILQMPVGVDQSQSVFVWQVDANGDYNQIATSGVSLATGSNRTGVLSFKLSPNEKWAIMASYTSGIIPFSFDHATGAIAPLSSAIWTEANAGTSSYGQAMDICWFPNSAAFIVNFLHGIKVFTIDDATGAVTAVSAFMLNPTAVSWNYNKILSSSIISSDMTKIISCIGKPMVPHGGVVSPDPDDDGPAVAWNFDPITYTFLNRIPWDYQPRNRANGHVFSMHPDGDKFAVLTEPVNASTVSPRNSDKQIGEYSLFDVFKITPTGIVYQF